MINGVYEPCTRTQGANFCTDNKNWLNKVCTMYGKKHNYALLFLLGGIVSYHWFQLSLSEIKTKYSKSVCFQNQMHDVYW